ncbi:PepSY domain-containing protein [Streptomyces sp. GTA36]
MEVRVHKRNSLRKRTLLGVIAAGGIAFGGATFAVAGQEDDQSAAASPGAEIQTKVQSAAPGVTDAPSTSAPINAAQAADLVLRQAGSGRIVQTSSVTENGRSVFKVDFVRGSTALQSTVDAATGTILFTTISTISDAGAGADGGAGAVAGSSDNGASTSDDSDGDDDSSDDEGEDEDGGGAGTGDTATGGAGTGGAATAAPTAAPTRSGVTPSK